MDVHDLVVIGGGIAGLRCASRFLGEAPGARVAVLEASGRWGGRMKTARLDLVGGGSVRVQAGAGVARAYKDRRLLSLAGEGAGTRFPACVNYRLPSSDPMKFVSKCVSMLTRAAATQRGGATFSAFARGVLDRAYGDGAYDEFVRAVGYSDFERADFVDVIRYYGLDDTFISDPDRQLVSIPWDALTKRLVDDVRIRGGLLRRSTRVLKVRRSARSGHYRVFAESGLILRAARVVIATTSLAAARIAPPEARALLDQVIPQPFLRIYAQLSASSRDAMRSRVPCMTVVANDLQKMFPVDPDRGVYCIAYADNDRAARLSTLARSRRALTALVREALDLPGIEILRTKSFFWEEGTHYFAPLDRRFMDRDRFVKRLQAPAECPGLFFAGEAFSRHQGWVEGALESADGVVDIMVKSWPQPKTSSKPAS